MVKLSLWSVGAALAIAMVLDVPVLAQEAAQEGAAAASLGRTIGLAVAAAFAVGVSILGAGYAVGKIGSAALGAAVERPELLTRSILFVALAEGLAVLGFAIAMMLLQKI
ncbi:MAG: ATP synthase subunit C [Syntrophales bacterium]|nr:ATP synthase subunit C [Syntrophales bacterium]